MDRELLQDHFLWIDEQKLESYTFREVSGYGVFWKPAIDKGSGFKLKVFEWACSGNNEEAWLYDIKSKTIQVELLMDFDAVFDGVRHFGIGDEGYINYPNFRRLSNLFLCIHALEQMYCHDVEDKNK